MTRKSFRLRKSLDNVLYTLLPNYWIPLYSSVQFTRMRFRDCIANKEWQDKVRYHKRKKNGKLQVVTKMILLQVIQTSLWCLGVAVFGILIMFFLQSIA